MFAQGADEANRGSGRHRTAEIPSGAPAGLVVMTLFDSVARPTAAPLVLCH